MISKLTDKTHSVFVYYLRIFPVSRILIDAVSIRCTLHDYRTAGNQHQSDDQDYGFRIGKHTWADDRNFIQYIVRNFSVYIY